ncbi:MAG: dihydrodipicolinate synthase family protein [Microbacterium sp.]
MSRFEFWAASLTPFDESGWLDAAVVPRQARHLAEAGVAGVFVNGTSGEFPSLSVDERLELAEAWLDAGEGLRIGVHVGGVPQQQAAELAAHAAARGADLVASVAPFYGEAPSASHVVDYLAAVAEAAGTTPLCYYQIPSMTGSTIRPSEVLALAREELPTLRSVKFTDADLLELDTILDGAADMTAYFGRDELLPAALAMGLGQAIGSLYNGLAPIAHAVVDAFDRGDVDRAYALHRPFREIARASTGPGFVKELMNRLGPDAGPARVPWGPVDPAGRAAIDTLLPSLQDALEQVKETTRA